MKDALGLAKSIKPVARVKLKKGGGTKKMLSWDQVPTINPQDLVGKRVFPIFADLTKAGTPYTGIDSSEIDSPEQMFGGPGYPLLPESQKHGLGWAVEGKGRGSAKIRKDADYVIVHAMDQTSHQSNASFANSLMKTMSKYVKDNRFEPENLHQLNEMVRRPSEQKELQSLKNFPGFEHPNVENFLRGLSFEARLRVARVLESAEAQKMGVPNIDKITRATLDPEFAGVPSRHGLFVMEIPKGTEDEQLVHLKTAGLPEHPSYQYGIKGRIVGKFHHPVAPEVLYSDWFDKKKAEQKEGKTNIRRAFDLAMPTVTVSQEVADRLPHRPQDIQSGKAAQLALNAFNDKWHDTDTAVNKGGLGPAQFSQALKNSDSSSTLSQYSPEDIKAMQKKGKFTGYKLKDGEVYFGLKRGTNYAEEYGFDHPDLTPNETSLVSVVNNEPGAKGIGGAPVVLKAIQHGATALDAYAVPTDKHPKGFLPNFYKHFGFEELGRVPFDPKYVTPQQFNDMKHEWKKTGWDEKRHGLPEIAIMKWRGSDDDRSDAVRNFVRKGGEGFGPRDGAEDVAAAAKLAQQGVGQAPEGPQRERSVGDASGDRGPVRADSVPRTSDRFTRTLSAVKGLSPQEAQHFGIASEDIEQAKASGLKRGGEVDDDHNNNLAKFQAGNHPDVPHVVYHGTVVKGTTYDAPKNKLPSGAFTVFDKNKLGSVSRSSDAKAGFWVTADHRRAQQAANDAYENSDDNTVSPYIHKLHISLKNPMIFDDIKDFEPHEVAKIANHAKKKGHDGLMFKQGEGGLPDYLLFDPNQMKSAVENNGNFDPNDPDITKSDGGEIENHYAAEHFEEGGEVEPPQRSIKAYKLFRTNPKAPGQIFPLFVDANTPVPMGKWVAAKAGDPGKDPTKVKSKLGDLAYRPGWHAGDLPVATHIGGKSDPSLKAPDIRPDNHVWAEVEMPDDVDWQSVADSRARITKSGKPDLKTAHITDQVPHGGHYRYKTNPNMTGNWIIGGSMKVNRILGDDEVKAINDANGVADLPRINKSDGGEVDRVGYGFGGDTVGAGSKPERGATGSVAAAAHEAPQQSYRDMPEHLQQAQHDLSAKNEAVINAMKEANARDKQASAEQFTSWANAGFPAGGFGSMATSEDTRPTAYAMSDISKKSPVMQDPAAIVASIASPAGTPTSGYDPKAQAAGTFTAGYNPQAIAAGTPTSGYDRLAMAAGTPTGGYNPIARAAGTPTGGYNPVAMAAGTPTSGYNPPPAMANVPMPPTYPAADSATFKLASTAAPTTDRGGGRRLVKKLMPDGTYQDVWEDAAARGGSIAKYRPTHHSSAIIEHALGKVAAPPPAFSQTLSVAKRGRPL